MLAEMISAVGRPFNEGRYDEARVELRTFETCDFYNQRSDLSLIVGALVYSFYLEKIDTAALITQSIFPGLGKVSIAKSPKVAGPPVVLWEKGPDYTSFIFSEDLIQHPWDTVFTVISRWAAVLFVCEAYSKASLGDGSVIINVGDQGSDRGLTFCDNRDSFTLMPDNYFLQYHGYKKARIELKSAFIDWISRQNKAFWRGSSTGDLFASRLLIPRVKLCELVRSCAEKDLFDCGISHIVQASSASEIEAVKALGIIREPVPLHEFGKYKIQIDIDGNTNSWPGLFSKLQTGSVVVKIQSQKAYRQWYYNRLIPWSNFVPVQSDMSDLIQIVQFLFDHDELAQAIGRRGQELADSMTFDREVADILPHVQGAMSAYKFRMTHGC